MAPFAIDPFLPDASGVMLMNVCMHVNRLGHIQEGPFLLMAGSAA